MIMVSVGTLDWHSISPKTLRRMPKSETFVMVATVAVTVRVSAILAAWPTGSALFAGSGALLADPPDAGGSPSGDGADSLAPEWFVLGGEPVTWGDVQHVNALGSVVTSRAVILNPPDVPSQQTYDNGVGLLTGGIVLGVGALGIVEGMLLIGPAFAVGAARSRRQLALLASAGGDRKAMRRVVLANGVLLGLVASVVGVVVGVGIAAAVQRVAVLRGSFALPDLRVPWWMAPVLVVLATLVATGAAFLPARRSSRMDVVTALAGRRAEASPHPAIPVVGVVLAGAGLVVALVGATTARSPLVVGGIVAFELGMVLAAGGIVSLVGLLAPHLPIAGRFAVRDAVRQRTRTAPALAAILAAMAGVTAALVYVQSADAQRDASHESIGVPGTVAVRSAPSPTGAPEPTADEVAAATRALQADPVVGQVAPVGVAVPQPGATSPGDGGGATGRAYAAVAGLTIDVVRAPDQECPLTAATDWSQRITTVDDRCDPDNTVWSTVWSDQDGAASHVVDDGTVVRLLGVPGSARAADALAAGKVVVRSGHDLRPDGTAHVAVHDNGVGGGSVEVASGDFPAVVVDLRNRHQLGLVLPPSVAARLGVTTRVAGLLATTVAMPDADDVSRLGREAGSAFGGVYVEAPPEPLGYVVWILVAAAFVVGLGSTGMSLSLAASESRPDLATLGAVGAAPRARRRIAAAQAGVLVVTGSVLGAATGLLLGRVLVTMKRYGGRIADPTWVAAIPWPALVAVVVGVPLLTMGGAWLLTRSRLPMVRRVVG